MGLDFDRNSWNVRTDHRGRTRMVRLRTTNHRPLIDIALLRSRAVATTMIAQFSSQAAVVIQFVLLAFIVQTPLALGVTYGFGGDAGDMARITVPGGILAVAAGFLVGYVSSRTGPRLPACVGFLLMTVGSALLAFAHSTFAPTVLAYCIFAFGSGLVMAAIPNLVIAATPVQLQAVTASSVNVVGSLGSAVAVQITFAILALNINTVAAGQPIYSGTGFTTVYIIAAGTALTGLVAAVLMPQGRGRPFIRMPQVADQT